MLVLTRKAGETVVIGNSIRVTVIELTPGVVRLGFDAPSEVSIYREEIYREIAAANRAAIDETGSPGPKGKDRSKDAPRGRTGKPRKAEDPEEEGNR